MDNYKMLDVLTSGRHKTKSQNPEKADSYYMNETEEYRKKYFQYAQNVYNILGQSLSDYKNSGIETEYLVRVSPVTDIKTGAKRGDDWKELSFYETFEKIPLGMKFHFSNNIWLVFNTDNFSPPIQRVVVRRCNSNLKHIDGNGNIHIEPCIWDKEIPMQTRINYRSATNIYTPELNMYVQSNDFTQSINTDDRYIFGKGKNAQAFKIKEPVDFILGETFNDDSAELILFSLERTLISTKLDDIENGIANRFASDIKPQINNTIVLSPDIEQIDLYETVTFNVNVNAEFIFYDVPAECYEVINITENSFKMFCKIAYDKNPLKIIAVANTDD